MNGNTPYSVSLTEWALLSTKRKMCMQKAMNKIATITPGTAVGM
jgi:hypothetical protein